MIRDAQGNVWELNVDLVACRRVRDLTGVNLLTLDASRIFAALADPLTLVSVLYAVCKPQADLRQMTEDAFWRAMAVDVNLVCERFVEKLSLFFQQLGQPTKATQLTTGMQRSRELLSRMTTEQLEQLTEQTFAWMASQIPTSFSGASAMSSPASSA